MNEMENFIDFLASKGVKSFHIEMQERNPLNSAEKEERTIEKPAVASKPYPVQDALAKHDIPVYRGGEEAVLASTLPPAVEKALPARIVETDETALKALADDRVAEEEKRAAAREKLVEKVIAPAAEKAIVTATQDRAKQPASGLTATQANASVKANAETTGAIAAEMIDPKKLYDRFCARITMDDGTFTVEERADLIGRMGLDDLLRINNDFSLGLDTDKPVEDVREDVKNCFR